MTNDQHADGDNRLFEFLKIKAHTHPCRCLLCCWFTPLRSFVRKERERAFREGIRYAAAIAIKQSELHENQEVPNKGS